ncbi:hypothetical protein BDQ17DRAFT_1429391 [Cyathus striatus]|nr:hypothetical protein BDQ17DRAFT_1429391 [Cyathus striatus]
MFTAQNLQLGGVSKAIRSYQPCSRISLTFKRTLSASKLRANKNTVIIGGGGAGAKIARALSQQLNPKGHSVTLIEEREYYLHYPASLRMIVSPHAALEDKVLIPFDKIFSNGKGNIITDAVSSISHN